MDERNKHILLIVVAILLLPAAGVVYQPLEPVETTGHHININPNPVSKEDISETASIVAYQPLSEEEREIADAFLSTGREEPYEATYRRTEEEKPAATFTRHQYIEYEGAYYPTLGVQTEGDEEFTKTSVGRGTAAFSMVILSIACFSVVASERDLYNHITPSNNS